MKILKKTFSILLICILVLTCTTPVFAADNDVQLRAQECGNCGKNTLNQVFVNSYETGPSQRLCNHGYPYGTDLVYTVHNVYQFKCGNCGYRSSTWERTSSRVVCYGHYN